MNFENLIELNHKKIDVNTIIHYPEVEDFCWYPYPNHPDGCPNRIKCQMLNVPDFGTILDYGKFTKFYLIYLIFDFKRYREIREKENPIFFNSEGRLRCNRYYQNSLKKIIKNYIENLNEINGDFYVLGCGSGFKLSFQKQVASMEAVCINVFSTMKLNGIKFEIKPNNKIIFCSLICSKKKLSFKKEPKQISIKNY